MKTSKSMLMAVISLALLFSMVSCKGKKGTDASNTQLKEYPVVVLSTSNTELQSVYPAVLKGEQDIDVKPRVDGFIEAIYVDEGASVRQGQPLFKINSPSSVEALKSAKASYSTAKLDVDRFKPLAEKGIISDVKIKSYENVLATAKANLDQAQASMSWATVTSPVSGIVGTIPFRQGSLVSSSSVLTSVANMSNVMAYFSINEKDLMQLFNEYPGATQSAKIKNMPAVRLQLSDGSIYGESGRIETISGIVDATSGAVNVRAKFPNKQGFLRSGSSAKVIIPQKFENVIVISQKATFAQQDKVMVFKAEGDSVVQKWIGVKSTPDGQSYVVTNGLSVGDKIVVDGIATLTNGQKIKQKITTQK